VTSMISLSHAFVVCTVLSKTSSPVMLIHISFRQFGGRQCRVQSGFHREQGR
jgi:hypothetical protein